MSEVPHTTSTREEKDEDGKDRVITVFHFTDLNKSVAAEDYAEALVNFESAFGVSAVDAQKKFDENQVVQADKAKVRAKYLQTKEEV